MTFIFYFVNTAHNAITRLYLGKNKLIKGYKLVDIIL